MLSISQLILSTPPKDLMSAKAYRLPIAHMAYRIGEGPHLYRANIPVPVRGGYMIIDDKEFDERGEHGPFCQEVMRECAAREFQGLILDFERPASPLSVKIVEALSAHVQKRALTLFLPEQYARHSPCAKIMVSSALSGGSLATRLGEAVERYGAGRTALAVERVSADFFLPSPTGQGQPLTREELRERIKARSPSIFFSSDLCAHYFTYMSPQTGAHFVLFDDAGSIRKKLHVAHSLGIETALLAYPETDDLLPALLA